MGEKDRDNQKWDRDENNTYCVFTLTVANSKKLICYRLH